MAGIARGFIDAVPRILEWRSLTLLGSAFPQSMGVVPTGGELAIPRVEWLSWLRLNEKVERRLTFGDYGIQHPETGDFDPRKMTMSACIRYTLEREWLLVKGQATKLVSASEQFPALATRLLAHPGYPGAAHCRGCGDVEACAAGAPNLGSLEAWRRIGTVHHLTSTVGQIASLKRAP